MLASASQCRYKDLNPHLDSTFKLLYALFALFALFAFLLHDISIPVYWFGFNDTAETVLYG